VHGVGVRRHARSARADALGRQDLHSAGHRQGRGRWGRPLYMQGREPAGSCPGRDARVRLPGLHGQECEATRVAPARPRTGRAARRWTLLDLLARRRPSARRAGVATVAKGACVVEAGVGKGSGITVNSMHACRTRSIRAAWLLGIPETLMFAPRSAARHRLDDVDGFSGGSRLDRFRRHSRFAQARSASD